MLAFFDGTSVHVTIMIVAVVGVVIVILVVFANKFNVGSVILIWFAPSFSMIFLS